jgi:hypothetical protein
MVRSDALRPLAEQSGMLIDKIRSLLHELAATRGDGRGSEAALRGVRSLGQDFEHSLDRLLFSTFVSCSGIALVTAVAWPTTALASP